MKTILFWLRVVFMVNVVRAVPIDKLWWVAGLLVLSEVVSAIRNSLNENEAYEQGRSDVRGEAYRTGFANGSRVGFKDASESLSWTEVES